MTLRLAGSTSGYTEIDAPAVAGSNTLVLPTGNGTNGQVLQTNGSGALSWASQRILQVVNTQTGTLATGTTIIPVDNTIPQNTEGTEFMTLAITPTSATSKLVIDVIWCGGINASNTLVVALFQDSIANAIATVSVAPTASAYFMTVPLKHYMTAGTTSSITFKVRAGMNGAGTTTFNGISSAGYFGGTIASSITITEIAA